jgi:hypothetical protein
MGKQVRFRLIKLCFLLAKLHEVLGVMVVLLLISIVWQSSDFVIKAKEWEVNEKMTILVHQG